MKSLYIVACSQTKQFSLRYRQMPARLVYCGLLFKLIVNALETKKLDYVILSAYYGILKPTTLIGFYDSSDFKNTPMDIPNDVAWVDRELIVVGGGRYCEAAERIFNRKVKGPLRGLSYPVSLRLAKTGEWFNRI